jgi:hypothetical protein
MNKAMHFKEINPIQWDALLVQYDESLWYQQARNIQLIASSYQKQSIYYACYHQSVFCAAMVLYVHKKNAALPTHFFYTPFFINASLKDFVVNQALNQMLLELKTEYHTIELKLAPKFNDIRAFTWSGFTHQLYYTLNKGLLLDEKKPSENIRRQINKIAQNEAIQVKVETTNLAFNEVINEEVTSTTLIRKISTLYELMKNQEFQLLNIIDQFTLKMINEIKDKDGNIVMDKIIKTLKIKADEFQKLFRIGYAFTTHSAQGMSIDKPYTIHEFGKMGQKLKYVALSRATKHENINIIM